MGRRQPKGEDAEKTSFSYFTLSAFVKFYGFGHEGNPLGFPFQISLSPEF